MAISIQYQNNKELTSWKIAQKINKFKNRIPCFKSAIEKDKKYIAFDKTGLVITEIVSKILKLLEHAHFKQFLDSFGHFYA